MDGRRQSLSKRCWVHILAMPIEEIAMDKDEIFTYMYTCVLERQTDRQKEGCCLIIPN
jgi:hypothetical protein